MARDVHGYVGFCVGLPMRPHHGSGSRSRSRSPHLVAIGGQHDMHGEQSSIDSIELPDHICKQMIDGFQHNNLNSLPYLQPNDPLPDQIRYLHALRGGASGSSSNTGDWTQIPARVYLYLGQWSAARLSQTCMGWRSTLWSMAQTAPVLGWMLCRIMTAYRKISLDAYLPKSRWSADSPLCENFLGCKKLTSLWLLWHDPVRNEAWRRLGFQFDCCCSLKGSMPIISYIEAQQPRTQQKPWIVCSIKCGCQLSVFLQWIYGPFAKSPWVLVTEPYRSGREPNWV